MSNSTLVKSLYLRMSDFGADRGKLEGSIEFTSQHGDIKVRVNNDQAHKIVAIVADELVRAAQETAALMTQQVIEQAANGVPLLHND